MKVKISLNWWEVIILAILIYALWCPNMDDKKLCRTEEKVRRFDEKTVKYFNLCEKEYNYRQITEYIDENMSEEMLKDICDGCSWYAISRCRANIVRKK